MGKKIRLSRKSKYTNTITGDKTVIVWEGSSTDEEYFDLSNWKLELIQEENEQEELTK